METTGTYNPEQALAVRQAFLEIKGNEGALDGIEPNDGMKDANLFDSALKGMMPSDVLTAIFQGRFEGGVPEQFKNVQPSDAEACTSDM